MTMATRIVVMKDGLIQQVDTPQNLYMYPCNMFVAGFIGSPQMNFVKVQLVEKAGDYYIEFAGNSLKLPASKVNDEVKEKAGQTVIVGIRPEHVHDEEEHLAKMPEYTIGCTVEVAEMMGSETYLYLDVEGSKFTARVSPKSTAKADDEIKVALDLNYCHLFDAETERTLVN
jgi:multiple sugar transport system ATP-binding protein